MSSWGLEERADRQQTKKPMNADGAGEELHGTDVKMTGWLNAGRGRRKAALRNHLNEIRRRQEAHVRSDLLTERGGKRAACPNVASQSRLLDREKQRKASNPGSSTCWLVTLAEVLHLSMPVSSSV